LKTGSEVVNKGRTKDSSSQRMNSRHQRDNHEMDDAWLQILKPFVLASL